MDGEKTREQGQFTSPLTTPFAHVHSGASYYQSAATCETPTNLHSSSTPKPPLTKPVNPVTHINCLYINTITTHLDGWHGNQGAVSLSVETTIIYTSLSLLDKTQLQKIESIIALSRKSHTTNIQSTYLHKYK